MKSQRGIVQGWLLLIGAIALIGALGGLVVAWKSYTNGIDQKGYDRGKQETEAAYAQRDNKALQDAIAERNAAQAKLDKQKKDADNQIKAIAVNYQGNLKNAKAQYDRDIACYKSGQCRLRDPGKPANVAGVGQAAGNNDKPAGCGPGAAGSGDDGLSSGASEFLLWLAGEADRLKGKCNALAAVVRADRVQINGAWNDQGHPMLRMEVTLNAP